MTYKVYDSPFGEELLMIEFEYDEDLVEEIKERLWGRWWDSDEKCWLAKDTI